MYHAKISKLYITFEIKIKFIKKNKIIKIKYIFQVNWVFSHQEFK